MNIDEWLTSDKEPDPKGRCYQCFTAGYEYARYQAARTLKAHHDLTRWFHSDPPDELDIDGNACSAWPAGYRQAQADATDILTT